MTRSRLVPVLLGAVLLMGAANLGAYAATGAPLLLGKKNDAPKTTTLKSAKGPALSLKTKSTAPPLAVSGSAKVEKLNADLLDGVDSSALKTKTFVFHLSGITPDNSFLYFDLAGLPAGKYLVSYNIGVEYPSSSSSIRGYFVRASGAADNGIHVSGEVAPYGGSTVVSSSGYLDTTTTTYRFWLQNTGGGMTVPSDDGLHTFPADLTFTRIDEAPESSKTGTATNTPSG